MIKKLNKITKNIDELIKSANIIELNRSLKILQLHGFALQCQNLIPSNYDFSNSENQLAILNLVKSNMKNLTIGEMFNKIIDLNSNFLNYIENYKKLITLI